MSNVYICTTPYHLLISAVKVSLHSTKKKDDVIICNKSAFTSETLAHLSTIFGNVYVASHKFSLFVIFLLKNRFLKKYSISDFFLKKILGYNKDYFQKKNVYIYADYCSIGCLLNLEMISYNIIEDGLNRYKFNLYPDKKHRFHHFIEILLGFSWKTGIESQFLNQIEVNELPNIPINGCKVIVSNREKMFSKLSPEEIDTIARLFNYIPFKMGKNSDKTILLTQPLSEDNIVDLQTKINIYRFLISKYAIGELYIKIHPREKCNYANYFPNAIILGAAKIPFEIYQLKENFHFKRAITAFSTAIDSISCADEKISMNERWVRNFSNCSEFAHNMRHP